MKKALSTLCVLALLLSLFSVAYVAGAADVTYGPNNPPHNATIIWDMDDLALDDTNYSSSANYPLKAVELAEGNRALKLTTVNKPTAKINNSTQVPLSAGATTDLTGTSVLWAYVDASNWRDATSFGLQLVDKNGVTVGFGLGGTLDYNRIEGWQCAIDGKLTTDHLQSWGWENVGAGFVGWIGINMEGCQGELASYVNDDGAKKAADFDWAHVAKVGFHAETTDGFSNLNAGSCIIFDNVAVEKNHEQVVNDFQKATVGTNIASTSPGAISDIVVNPIGSPQWFGEGVIVDGTTLTNAKLNGTGNKVMSWKATVDNFMPGSWASDIVVPRVRFKTRDGAPYDLPTDTGTGHAYHADWMTVYIDASSYEGDFAAMVMFQTCQYQYGTTTAKWPKWTLGNNANVYYQADGSDEWEKATLVSVANMPKYADQAAAGSGTTTNSGYGINLVQLPARFTGVLKVSLDPDGIMVLGSLTDLDGCRTFNPTLLDQSGISFGNLPGAETDIAKNNIVYYDNFTLIRETPTGYKPAVTFNPANGGALTSVEIDGDGKVTIDDPVWEDHTFLGWFAPASSTAVDLTTATFTEAVTLTAHWKENDLLKLDVVVGAEKVLPGEDLTVEVKMDCNFDSVSGQFTLTYDKDAFTVKEAKPGTAFDAEGDDAVQVAEIDYTTTEGQIVLGTVAAETLPKTGSLMVVTFTAKEAAAVDDYTFAVTVNEWFDKEETPVPDTAIRKTEAEVAVPVSHVVTFKEAGKDDVTVRVETNTKVAAPTDPTPAEGKKFDGWFAPEAQAAFDFTNTAITGDLTLTAQFSDITYTVDFVANGEAYGEQDVVAYGGKATKPADPSAPEGKRFAYWYAGDTDNGEYDFSTVLNGNLVLTAKFVDNNHTVNFYNVGSGEAYDTQVIADGEKAAKPQTDPTYESFPFLFWSADTEDPEEFDFENTAITEDLDLYAFYQLYGDLNADGKVTVTDARFVLSYVLGKKDSINTILADVNGDGKVNTMDVRFILRYALELITEFPAEQPK